MSQVTDFAGLHDAMEAALKAKLPALRTVDALSDEPPSDRVLTPAVFVGVEEMTKSRKLTDGRVALTCQMVAYCLLSEKTPRADVEILNMAASVASVVDGNRWGLSGCVDVPKSLSALPGTFSAGGKGVKCWAVSWEQTIHIGQEWKPEDPEITGVWLAGCHDHLHPLPRFPDVNE